MALPLNELIVPILVAGTTVISKFIITILFILYQFISDIKNELDNLVGNPKSMADAQRIIDDIEESSAKAFISRLTKNYQALEKVKRYAYVWGEDLALLAFTLGMTAFFIMAIDKDFFPFFRRLEELSTINYLLAGFILLFLGYYLLYLVNIYFCHKHKSKIDKVLDYDLGSFPSKTWIYQNIYFIISFFVGFISLISVIFIMIFNKI